MNQKIIKLSKKTCSTGEILQIQLEKDLELMEILKRNFVGVKWNPALLKWELPYDPKLKSLFFTAFKGKAWLDYSQLIEDIDGKKSPKSPEPKLNPLSPHHQEKINAFTVFLQNQRYSPSTIKTYTDTLSVFFRFHGTKETHELHNEDLTEFMHKYIIKVGYSYS
jgi:integrase/recombinase XerD